MIEEPDTTADMILTRKAQNLFKELKVSHDDVSGMQAVFIARDDEQKAFAREKFKNVIRH